MAKKNDYDKKLGLTLRALREFSSLSRESVSQATGISVSAIASIEDGRHPTSRQLAQLTSHYGWTIKPASRKMPEKGAVNDDVKPARTEPDGPWELYTDGSCVPKPGKGACAYVLVYDGIEMERTSFFEPGPVTNNIMELTAVINGLKAALLKGIRTIDVYSDSIYVVKGITEWIYTWLSKDPELRDRSNGELWMELNRLRKKFAACRFHWVKGHADNRFNEIADHLCESEYMKRGLPGQDYFRRHCRQNGK